MTCYAHCCCTLTKAPTQQAQDLHIKTKISLVCRDPDFPQQGSLPSLELILAKVNIKAGRPSYCKRNRDFVQCSLHYPLFLREAKKPTLLSRKPHALGHFIKASTGMGFKWRKLVEEALKACNPGWRPPTQLPPFMRPFLFTTQVCRLKYSDLWGPRGVKAAEAGRQGWKSKKPQSWFAWEKQWFLRPQLLVAKIRYPWEQVCVFQTLLSEGQQCHEEHEMNRVTRI